MGDQPHIVYLVLYPLKLISSINWTKNLPTGAQQDSEARLILIHNDPTIETI
ncbi:hypothetical protein PanWU01x14_000410, partial [Parasponia andersonii]